jgi:hypothetical protein
MDSPFYVITILCLFVVGLSLHISAYFYYLSTLEPSYLLLLVLKQ